MAQPSYPGNLLGMFPEQPPWSAPAIPVVLPSLSRTGFLVLRCHPCGAIPEQGSVTRADIPEERDREFLQRRSCTPFWRSKCTLIPCSRPISEPLSLLSERSGHSQGRNWPQTSMEWAERAAGPHSLLGTCSGCALWSWSHPPAVLGDPNVTREIILCLLIQGWDPPRAGAPRL